ncbi:hypothetical protein [Oribacterium sp. WCC10]|uniref:hypothetical protein n=1 Tax=Oribacterium sp. WCC10 TaxID=1855343 RepID=UPI0008EC3C4B|nr:hypothetical protein [Oribacterium sp. WCC10]SFG62032.1 hypothetical protein SAMN05216356_11521 [Oribacterium sp. WCC10]
MKKCFKTMLFGMLGVMAAVNISACGATDVPVAGAMEETVAETEAKTESETESATEATTEKQKEEESASKKDNIAKELTKETLKEDAEDHSGDIDKIEEKSDKEPNKDIVKAIESGEKLSYTAKDVVGCWKYEKYDNMYLDLYDNGKYEIHDLKSGDITSDGSFKVDGNTIELTENGKDPQIMQIASKVRLLDDEGDLLTPYVPETEIKADASGEKMNRSYGNPHYGDVDFAYDGDGIWKMRSKNMGALIKYPDSFYADYGDDFLYVYDGDAAYATVRNVTAEYYDYMGSDEDFVADYSDTSLFEDFRYFYGDVDAVEYSSCKLNPTDKHFSENYMKLSNDYYDVQCASTIFYSEFKDGTNYLIMLNKFYRYGDKDSKNSIKAVKAAGYR